MHEQSSQSLLPADTDAALFDVSFSELPVENVGISRIKNSFFSFLREFFHSGTKNSSEFFHCRLEVLTVTFRGKLSFRPWVWSQHHTIIITCRSQLSSVCSNWTVSYNKFWRTYWLFQRNDSKTPAKTVRKDVVRFFQNLPKPRTTTQSTFTVRSKNLWAPVWKQSRTGKSWGK